MKHADEVGSEILIDRLSLADLPEILEIENASYSTPWRELTFTGLLRRADTDPLGARREGKLVGYAISWTIGDQAELGNVAVAPEERGRGTGRRLVEAALAGVRERGARECFLEVRISNEIARTIYEECGFRIVGRRRNYYARPVEDAYVMRKDFI